MNNKLYTAVGKLKMKDQNDVRILCVSIGQKEYILNAQEMVLWMELNYKVLNADEVHKLCGNKTWETGSNAEECIRRLVQRGLIAEGSGDTKEDMLYNLFAELYVIPETEAPISTKEKSDEEKITRLIKYVVLSTAEIIKCIELNILNLHTDEEILDCLYSDDYTTSENIVYTVRYLSKRQSVIEAVVNLYQCRQIRFDRI